jgi:hypothetical protein
VARAEPRRPRSRMRAMVPAPDSEARVMSGCRAHREPVRRRVLVSRNPLAPDTDLHHRTIRECWVDYRTDGASGRDEKDVGVRSCSCGVAVWLRRKVLLEWLTGTAGKTHAKSGTLFCLERRATGAALVQEWYYRSPQMSSNK